MSYFTDAQLEAMMADLESDRAERKQSFQGDAPQKVREAVCAFANDLAGHGEPGVVLIGVHDNGTPMPGFVVTDELLRSLGSTCKCNTLTSVGWLHGNDETALPTSVG